MLRAAMRPRAPITSRRFRSIRRIETAPSTPPNAYIRAGNSGGAAEALEYLIAIDPNDLAPYVTLKQLYPDAASRPQRLTQLLQQGYERTGEASLLD